MAKKKNKAPKRIAGLKLSKKMRKRIIAFNRFAQSPIGSAFIAETTVSSVKSVLGNDKVRAAAADARRDIQQMGMLAVARIRAIATAAREAALEQGQPVEEPRPKRKRVEADRSGEDGAQEVAH
jgi:hypothetical protein